MLATVGWKMSEVLVGIHMLQQQQRIPTRPKPNRISGYSDGGGNQGLLKDFRVDAEGTCGSWERGAL